MGPVDVVAVVASSNPAGCTELENFRGISILFCVILEILDKHLVAVPMSEGDVEIYLLWSAQLHKKASAFGWRLTLVKG